MCAINFEGSRVTLQSNFHRDWIKISSLIFENAYRANHLEEPLENQYEDGVANVVQTFCEIKIMVIGL